VRFLIDRCAGRRVVDWLRREGPDVVESRERGPDPGDRVLLEWAATEARILVTMDKDFGDLIFTKGAAHTGMIRLPDVPVARRILLISQVIGDMSAEDLALSIVTISENRIRVSKPPQSSS